MSTPQSRGLRRAAVVAVAVTLTCGACGGSGSKSGSARPATAPTTGRADAAGTVWLCRPGLVNDPCASDLTTTVVPASGARTVQTPHPAAGSAFDCFYVYPTVSTEPTDNA